MTRLRIGVANEAVALKRAAWLSERIGATDVALDVVPVDVADGALGGVAAPLDLGDLDGVWMDARRLPGGERSVRTCAACVTRLNPRMALVDRESYRFDRVPPGRRIAVSDELVARQVQNARPDIEWLSLDGDVSTQLHKVHIGNADGLVAAASDLLALGFAERAFDYVSTEVALPPAGQGIWVLRAVVGSAAWRAFAPLDDAESRRGLNAEFGFVEALGEEGRTPVGVSARVQRGKLHLEAVVCAGDVPVRAAAAGSPDEAGIVVADLVSAFRSRGIG